jgi:hypothetical protein
MKKARKRRELCLGGGEYEEIDGDSDYVLQINTFANRNIFYTTINQNANR